MKYLLDTNIIIAFQKQHQGLLAQMKKHSVNDFALSNMWYLENTGWQAIALASIGKRGGHRL